MKIKILFFLVLLVILFPNTPKAAATPQKITYEAIIPAGAPTIAKSPRQPKAAASIFFTHSRVSPKRKGGQPWRIFRPPMEPI